MQEKTSWYSNIMVRYEYQIQLLGQNPTSELHIKTEYFEYKSTNQQTIM